MKFLILFALFVFIISEGTLVTLTAAQISEIVSESNTCRAKVKPSAKPALKPLTWSHELQHIAENWAKKCVNNGEGFLAHNPNRKMPNGQPYGENIFATSATAQQTSVKQAVTSWDSEKKYFNDKTNQCKNGQVCGHYTQLVWARTRQVGCAIVTCPGFTYQTSMVCEYYPAGNWIGQKPYSPKAGAVTTLENLLDGNAVDNLLEMTKTEDIATVEDDAEVDDKNFSTTEQKILLTTKDIELLIKNNKEKLLKNPKFQKFLAKFKGVSDQFNSSTHNTEQLLKTLQKLLKSLEKMLNITTTTPPPPPITTPTAK